MDPAAMPACPLGAVTLAIALAIALTLAAPPLPLPLAIAIPCRRHRRRRAASLSRRLSGELTTARPWWRLAWEELTTARAGGAPPGP